MLNLESRELILTWNPQDEALDGSNLFLGLNTCMKNHQSLTAGLRPEQRSTNWWENEDLILPDTELLAEPGGFPEDFPHFSVCSLILAPGEIFPAVSSGCNRIYSIFYSLSSCSRWPHEMQVRRFLSISLEGSKAANLSSIPRLNAPFKAIY